MGPGLTRYLNLGRQRNWSHLKPHRQGRDPWVTIIQVVQDYLKFSIESPASPGNVLVLGKLDSGHHDSSQIPEGKGPGRTTPKKLQEPCSPSFCPSVHGAWNFSWRRGKRVWLSSWQPIFQGHWGGVNSSAGLGGPVGTCLPQLLPSFSRLAVTDCDS